jgi:threonine dehydrogenase-like Zn-dependent dehydrogenase
MRSVVARAGRLVLESQPRPEPGPGEARVRMLACGICGSDLHFHHAGLFADGHVPGHEMLGEVDALTDAATGIAVGETVAIEPLLACGSCPSCRAGRPGICPELQIYGIHRPGGLAEFVCVPERCLYRVPSRLPTEIAAMAEPMAVAWHGVAQSGLASGERVLVLGAGSIGLLCVLAARDQGAGEVWISARHPHQAELARSLGATRVLGEDEASPKALPRTTLDAPVDRVIETVGGSADLLRSAAAAGRPGGAISVLGLFLGDAHVPGMPMLLKEATLVWSNCYQRAGAQPDFARAIALLDEERSRVAALTTHQVALDEVERGFALAADRAAGAVKVTVRTR